LPAKCPKCGGEAKLEAIRNAGGRCPHCKARIKIRFTGVPRPVRRAPGKTPGIGSLRSSLESIGPYEVISEISRGGMGIVYKARDRNLKKTVAIKVLIRGGQASEEERKRFRREAESAAKLQHSNIVPIHSVGVCDGLPYFVMDFIEGEQLDVLVDRGSVSPRQALDYTEQLADALAYAHAAGVIHRDIKPANVIVDRYGRPQLMDFGLAKDVEAGNRTRLTQVGTTMGTPTYMPPEQAEGDLEGIDAQSDVYSLGAVLYEMLTGTPPFEGATTMAILMKVLEEDPPRPRRINPRIHRDIEIICLKAMAKDKRERYRSAEQLREDIRRFKAGEAINAAPPGTTREFFRWCRRHREMVAALFLVVAGLGGWGGYDMWTRHEQRRSAALTRKTLIGEKLADATRLEDGGAADDQGLQRAARLYQRVLDFDPPPPKKIADQARDGLKRITRVHRARQIGSLLEMGRLFVEQQNYQAAAHVFRLVLNKWESKNTEARHGLRKAMGTGTLMVTSNPPGADVYFATGKDFPEPPYRTSNDRLGELLGQTPFKQAVDVPMGLHRLTLVKAGYGRQSVPVRVGRNRKLRVDEVAMIRVKDVGSPEAAINVVLVPGGKIEVDGDAVNVDPFYIDRYEYPNRLGVKPVCGKTRKRQNKAWNWHVAQAMAEDAGKKLPTRAQWVLAAEGPKGLLYPYGNEFDPGASAVGGAEKDGPLPVGNKPGDRSPFGAFDMSGNVAEWIRYEPSGGDPTEFEPEEIYSAAGGNWASDSKDHGQCRYLREYLPEEERSEVGFRCVLPKGKQVAPREEPSIPGPKVENKYEFKETWVDKCPPGMVEIRPRKGTAAYKLVPYAFCIDAREHPNKPGAKPWRGSWLEAYALARKLGRRLPRRKEWQVACGGPNLVKYPFGQHWKGGERKPAALGHKAHEPQNPFPCGTSEESDGFHWKAMIYDLCGNVSEWVFDKYAGDARLRGVVGGCWWSKPEDVGTEKWEGKPPTAKGKGGGVTGFRCVVRLK
jgi:serine/threonine protein kinase/formylglycine-generating enzyme required for sulfatase activity